VRNEHNEPVNYALRIWIVDERGRVKGTQEYCAADPIARATRGPVFLPVEIPGVTLRDRAVVTVSSAASGQFQWRLRENDAEQLTAIVTSARGATGRLSFQREASVPGGWVCPCDSAALESVCDARCSAGRAAVTCTPTFNGSCSSVCTCK